MPTVKHCLGMSNVIQLISGLFVYYKSRLVSSKHITFTPFDNSIMKAVLAALSVISFHSSFPSSGCTCSEKNHKVMRK